MRHRFHRILTTLGFISCVGMIAPACVIKASGQARVRPVYVVQQEPPAPKYESPAPRPGHVWIRGHWEWRGNNWVWKQGHWERVRQGRNWTPGHWERRGNQWHWVEGRWVAGDATPPPPPQVGQFPTAPPPQPTYETPAPRAGYVWIQGHYEWKNGQYAWVKGHWERARAAQKWIAGRWELQAGRYVWIEGKWVDSGIVPPHIGNGGNPGQFPTAPPPKPRYETPAPRAGYVWIQGHYEWKNGQYGWVKGHWERARAAQKWVAGRWELQAGRYVWVEGKWVDSGIVPPHIGGGGDAGQFPTAPPPAPSYEKPKPRAGYVWAQGHYEWKNGKYKWVKGHWERARKGYQWQPGHWEQRGNQWHWVPGEWIVVATGPSGEVVDGPVSAPPQPNYETPKPRAGYVWIQGHYEWKNGQYQWVKGHWERARRQQVWQPGTWTLRGKVYVWTPGKWTRKR